MNQNLRDKIAEAVVNQSVLTSGLVDALEALIEREKAASYLEGMKDAEALFTE